MIKEGLFEQFPMDAVFGMHNWPGMPAGTVGINRGAMMAAADRITVNLAPAERARIRWSPTKTVSSPSMTYNVSSASWWMCKGGAVPRGSIEWTWTSRPSRPMTNVSGTPYTPHSMEARPLRMAPTSSATARTAIFR